ncbi:MAG: (d)CMP kinase [Flavobacteriales bacterium]|nr:(d)CMP kinase [Flavobacteriales bacterium]
MTSEDKINIAIDGYSSCGKSTLAKMLANDLGYIYVDTGAMYRAITLFFLENSSGPFKVNTEEVIGKLKEINLDVQNHDGLTEVLLNGENVESKIRTLEVANYVSEISAIREVREKCVQIQQDIGKRKGIIMDGRDIGTVVMPFAELKLFLTAKKHIRVKRRYDELISKGYDITSQEVEENISKRDKFDMEREESPLRKADDAIEIDNSELSLEQQKDLVVGWVQQKIKTRNLDQTKIRK